MGRIAAYFASGPYRIEYESLPYEKLYLVDNHLRPFRSEKVIPVRMDALSAIRHFKDNHILLDCAICVNESRGEGGGFYSLCSDTFLGYLMTILQNDCILICNPVNYYDFRYGEKSRRPYYVKPEQRMSMLSGANYVTLDLPYKMTLFGEDDPDYIDPTKITTEYYMARNQVMEYHMEYQLKSETYGPFNGMLITVVQDSIWNHYDELDALLISFRPDNNLFGTYFEQHYPKSSYYKYKDFSHILESKIESGCTNIGITPH